MANTDKWLADLVASLVEKANANIALMDGTTDPLKKIIGNADLVVGIWQDPSEPFGVGQLFVKGEHLLRDIIAQDTPANIRFDAIPCECVEEAVAIRDVLGEQAHLH